jgi:bifunctional ADP-heptose synthase (sugar kinase/adenylyltransferase)
MTYRHVILVLAVNDDASARRLKALERPLVSLTREKSRTALVERIRRMGKQ